MQAPACRYHRGTTREHHETNRRPHIKANLVRKRVQHACHIAKRKFKNGYRQFSTTICAAIILQEVVGNLARRFGDPRILHLIDAVHCVRNGQLQGYGTWSKAWRTLCQEVAIQRAMTLGLVEKVTSYLQERGITRRNGVSDTMLKRYLQAGQLMGFVLCFDRQLSPPQPASQMTVAVAESSTGGW